VSKIAQLRQIMTHENETRYLLEDNYYGMYKIQFWNPKDSWRIATAKQFTNQQSVTSMLDYWLTYDGGKLLQTHISKCMPYCKNTVNKFTIFRILGKLELANINWTCKYDHQRFCNAS